LAAQSIRPVLLVDDDPSQLWVREAVLRRYHFDVAVATSAEAALALLRGEPHAFSAIITDHILPGASGAEFVRMLRAVDANIPVIVVTGLAEAESEYAGLGVNFQQKPLAPEELIRQLRIVTQRTA